MTVFGKRVVKKMIKTNRILIQLRIKVGSSPVGPVSLSEEEIETYTHAEGRPCEQTGGKWPSVAMQVSTL